MALRKFALDAEREGADGMGRAVRYLEVRRDAGVIPDTEVNPAAQEVVRARIRVVQRGRDYADALDRLRLRFDVKPEQLGEGGASPLAPLTRHVRRYDELHKEHHALREAVAALRDPVLAPKVRGELRKLFASAALTRGTRARDGLPRRWAEVEKLTGPELRDAADKVRGERDRLVNDRADATLRGKPFAEADARRLAEAEAGTAAAEFEQALRRYEARPVLEEFQNLTGRILSLADLANRERLEQLRAGWPAPPPITVGRVDLLAGDGAEAARRLAGLPGAGPAAAAKLRNARALAETYRLRRRLFELAHAQRRLGADVVELWEKALGDAGPFVRPADAQMLFDAERALADAKIGLGFTWAEYHHARLDFYRELGAAPP